MACWSVRVKPMSHPSPAKARVLATATGRARETAKPMASADHPAGWARTRRSAWMSTALRRTSPSPRPESRFPSKRGRLCRSRPSALMRPHPPRSLPHTARAARPCGTAPSWRTRSACSSLRASSAGKSIRNRGSTPVREYPANSGSTPANTTGCCAPFRRVNRRFQRHCARSRTGAVRGDRAARCTACGCPRTGRRSAVRPHQSAPPSRSARRSNQHMLLSMCRRRLNSASRKSRCPR